MTAIPAPPWRASLVDGGGRLTPPWRYWFEQVYDALYGQGFDKVDAAWRTAQAAAPGSATVVGAGGLQGGGTLADGAGVSLYVAAEVVAMLPASGVAVGDWAYAFDGRKPGEGAGAGTGVPCFWSNGAWIAVTSGAAVTA